MKRRGIDRTARRGRRRVAMTLVELLVAGGVLVLVLGLALRMLGETREVSERVSERARLLNEGQVMMALVTRQLQHAARPSDLAVELTQPLRFDREHLTLPVVDPVKGELEEVTLHVTGGKPDEWRVERRPAGAGEEAEMSMDWLAPQLPRGYSVSMQFAFAGYPDPGQPVQYRDQWPAEAWPALVRVTYRVHRPEVEEATMELETAVRLGPWVSSHMDDEATTTTGEGA